MVDVLELLQDTSEVISLHDPQVLSADRDRLSDISVRCCGRVPHVLTLLPQLKDPMVAASVMKTC